MLKYSLYRVKPEQITANINAVNKNSLQTNLSEIDGITFTGGALIGHKILVHKDGVHYSYFTVRVTMNNFLVPSFH